jgi:ectoine hydroxylase-related dioxygenase (phytanoyl-CoA dioxygenase family)
MSKAFNQIQPHQAIAICTPEQAGQLVHYDHYVVAVTGRLGVMLTHAWTPLEEHAGPLVLTVVFHHVEKHPRVPEEIQSIVDRLEFRVRGQPR